VRVGVVGHRFLSAQGRAFAQRACADLFAQVASKGREITAVSALAEGADTVFADVALRSGMPLEAVQPHDEYLYDFRSNAARSTYLTMWPLARRRTVLPYRHRCDAAYEAGMRWVVDRSSMLVAIWDGHPSHSIGGTAQTVTYARRSGCPVIHMSTLAERVAVV
jgi:hypothetical protein